MHPTCCRIVIKLLITGTYTQISMSTSAASLSIPIEMQFMHLTQPHSLLQNVLVVYGVATSLFLWMHLKKIHIMI